MPSSRDGHRSSGFDAARFRKWRLRKHLGQRDLAKRLQYSQGLISQIERGTREPSKRFLEFLHLVYDVDPAIFYRAVILLAIVTER